MPILTLHANGKKTKISVGKFTPSSVNPNELISSDVNNALKLGSDGKLLIDNIDDVKTNADFVALINTVWNI